MELGTGVMIAGVAVPTAAVVITALKTRNGNGNGNGKPCPLHSGFEATLEYLKDAVDETKGDVKRILGKIGGV